MSLTLTTILLTLAIIMAMGTGLWLFLNAPSVVRLFRSAEQIEVESASKTASRSTTLLMLVLFNAGWIGAILVWSLAMAD